MALTIDDLRVMDVRSIFYGDRDMAEYIVLTAPTEQEAKQKAQEMIKTIDPYRQPSLYSCYQHMSGDWKATVQVFGLD